MTRKGGGMVSEGRVKSGEREWGGNEGCKYEETVCVGEVSMKAALSVLE